MSAQLLQRSRVREGQAFPLGATWTGLGVNFALFSANATKVELCLFDDAGEAEVERIELPEYTDEVWHGFLPVPAPARSTVTACTARTSQTTVIASIPTSFCSIHTRWQWLETSIGTRLSSATSWKLGTI